MGNKSSKKMDLTDMTFEMRFQSKTLDKQAIKVESQMKKEEKKCLELMDKGLHDAARISAENVIRLKNEGLNCRRMAAQMGAVAMKLESAERTQNISMNIKQAVPMIEKGLKTMEKIGIDRAVNDFENAFETLDVKTESMNAAMEGVHSSAIGAGQVDELLGQLRDQQANSVENNAGRVASGQISSGQQEVKNEDDDLMARLKNL